MNKFHEVQENFKKNQGGAKLPLRATKGSAGYDFFLQEDVVIPKAKIKLLNKLTNEASMVDVVDYLNNLEENVELEYSQVLHFTDVSVELDEGAFLMLVPRSSAGTKLGVLLANTVGIIDKDYFKNQSTGGNIGICLKNLGNEDIYLKKGEHIAQGIILPYYETVDDTTTAERIGGFGSSNK